MFRHTGKARTYSHNLKLASILSCVAGIVNITGVLKLNILTTNVTGHFAFFSEKLIVENYPVACSYLVYILSYLFGAFFSSIILEWIANHYQKTSYSLAITIEIFVLVGVSIISYDLNKKDHWIDVTIASILLFAMGLQNALVTRVSRSVVRTTHLTGLFTDLGIELSRLCFENDCHQLSSLQKSIFLKLAIISCFFAGCVLGSYTFRYLDFRTLFLPVGLLIFALWYDRISLGYYKLKRKIEHRH